MHLIIFGKRGSLHVNVIEQITFTSVLHGKKLLVLAHVRHSAREPNWRRTQETFWIYEKESSLLMTCLYSVDKHFNPNLMFSTACQIQYLAFAILGWDIFRALKRLFWIKGQHPLQSRQTNNFSKFLCHLHKGLIRKRTAIKSSISKEEEDLRY